MPRWKIFVLIGNIWHFIKSTERSEENPSIYYRWVNEGYGESCLEVAEELANQTPVRLDLLLSILPPLESTETVVVDRPQVGELEKLSKAYGLELSVNGPLTI